MTRDQYIIRRKLNIVELGATLGNISDACRRLGVSRQHFYDIKKAVEEEGVEGLLEKSRQSPRMGLRIEDQGRVGACLEAQSADEVLVPGATLLSDLDLEGNLQFALRTAQDEPPVRYLGLGGGASPKAERGPDLVLRLEPGH